jgi:hypothetical protein
VARTGEIVIIVEGPDGSGKTTLCKKLCEDLDLEYMRYSGLSSETGPDGLGIVDWWDSHLEKGTDAVFDRCFYISELLYQLVTPGRDLIAEPQKMLAGIHELWLENPVMIFCLTDWETEEPIISSRAGLKGVTMSSMEKVSWAYWSMYALWNDNLGYVHQYDWRTSDYEALKEAIG